MNLNYPRTIFHSFIVMAAVTLSGCGNSHQVAPDGKEGFSEAEALAAAQSVEDTERANRQSEVKKK